MTPALVTLFGDSENERRRVMEMTSDDVFYGGGLWDNITHIFNQAKQAVGAIDIKSPTTAPGTPVAVAPNNLSAMLKNPVVIGGAVLVGAMLFLKSRKGRR